VYLAADLPHGRQVAIKVLRPELALAIGPERFMREIQIVARLSHPGILPLLDSGEAEQLLYYVMPFVPGETLRTRLERDRQIPIEDAVAIAGEVAEAMQYAHRQGSVHRDIKPGNILIESGRAMVMDFGIARLIGSAGDSSISSSGVAIGTPGYMSPEQAAADTVIDGRSDIYSLGCVLYEMFAGERPFSGPTPLAMTLRHIHERVPSVRVVRPQVPERLQVVVEKCLAKAPADRYPSGAALGQALRGEETPAPRRSWKLWGLLLLALGIATGA